MSKIDTSWEQTLRENPDIDVDAVVRTIDVDAAESGDWEAWGLQLRHTYRLVPGAAVTGPAQALLELAQEPWVTHIEPDQEVRAYGNTV